MVGEALRPDGLCLLAVRCGSFGGEQGPKPDHRLDDTGGHSRDLRGAGDALARRIAVLVLNHGRSFLLSLRDRATVGDE